MLGIFPECKFSGISQSSGITAYDFQENDWQEEKNGGVRSGLTKKVNWIYYLSLGNSKIT